MPLIAPTAVALISVPPKFRRLRSLGGFLFGDDMEPAAQYTTQTVAPIDPDPVADAIERLERRKAKVDLHLRLALIDCQEYYGDDWRAVVTAAMERVSDDS